MLPAAARLRRSEDFREVMRRGSRAGRRRLVVHVLQGQDPSAHGARAGFVVSKAVGNSVVRHRVARRLRHLVAARLGTVPGGSSLVIRALPPAATSSSAELGADLDAALKRLSALPNRRAPGPAENNHDGSAV
jgi:ribonuclease P protein component